MTGVYSDAISWFALFSTIVDFDTKCANHRRSPDSKCSSLNQQPKMSYLKIQPNNKIGKGSNSVMLCTLLRFVLHAAAEVKAVDNGKDGDFSRCRMWCSKVHARHQEQRVALIELRVLRVLPRQRFHVIRIFDRRRKARPPHNYLTVLRARREHFSAV